MKNKNQEKIGIIKYNIYGTRMKVIEYINSENVLVEFDDGFNKCIRKMHWEVFQHGTIPSLYDKSVLKIGYMGEGRYTSGNSKKNDKSFKRYKVWRKMLEHCYSSKWLKNFSGCKGNSVCTEWLNFQNFAKWYDENYYNIGNEQICLNKNIIIPHCKKYSPLTTIFVPRTINDLFIERPRKSKLPTNIFYEVSVNKYYIEYRI